MPRDRTNRSAAHDVGCTTDSGFLTQLSQRRLVGVELQVYGLLTELVGSVTQPRQQQVRLGAVEPTSPEHCLRLDEQHRLVGGVEELRAELVGEQPPTGHGPGRLPCSWIDPPCGSSVSPRAASCSSSSPSSVSASGRRSPRSLRSCSRAPVSPSAPDGTPPVPGAGRVHAVGVAAAHVRSGGGRGLAVDRAAIGRGAQRIAHGRSTPPYARA